MAREVLRYAAFTSDGGGGNPAGVVLDARGLSDAEMLAIAADLGYSETAFVTGGSDDRSRHVVRYFAPLQEVPFCGHATVATAVALAERGAPADLVFETVAGLVPVRTERTEAGIIAELTSVDPTSSAAGAVLIAEVLASLRWAASDLDPAYPVEIADAGARHLIMVTRTRARLADLDYDFDALAEIMRRENVITLQLVWPESAHRFHSRNPFAGSGVVEDPATGAAAAALGGYLRQHGKIAEDATFTISQGVDMGRPSEITVRVVAGARGVVVRGSAHSIES